MGVSLTAVSQSSGTPGVPLARQVSPSTWATPTAGKDITGPLTFTVANPYQTASPRANNWTAPTPVFLRALTEDTRLLAGGGSSTVQIRSMRDPDPIIEGGIVVLNGRLKVNNALGTDTLRTPIGVRVEYWNGTAWVGHAGYADTGTAVASSSALFTDCTRGLATAATPPSNCQAVVGGDTQAVTLVNGVGTVWMRAPGKLASGRSRDGGANVQFPYRAWLPSTVGRVTFGTYRSPLIYVREVY
jgi:MSHA biogenesis protein MshQ